MAGAMLEEAAVDIWVVVALVAADFTAVADTAAELMEEAIAAAHTREAMQPAADTAAHTRAEAPLLPDRGPGKAKARRATLLRVGTDSREIAAR